MDVLFWGLLFLCLMYDWCNENKELDDYLSLQKKDNIYFPGSKITLF